MGTSGIILHDFLDIPWEQARGYLKEELDQLKRRLNRLSSKVPDDLSYSWSAPFLIDGAGAPITTGEKGYIYIPFDSTLTEIVLLVAENAGAVAPGDGIVIDLWRVPFDDFPPTVDNTISGDDKPTLDEEASYRDKALTGWNVTLSAGDILGVNVDSAAGYTKVLLNLTLRSTATIA